MPTIIALDNSVTMGSPAAQFPPVPKLELVVKGLNTFLDYIGARQKLEFLSLLTFSSACDVVVPFTRDVASIKHELNIMHRSLSSTVSLLPVVPPVVEELFLNEWDSGTDCNLLIVADESVGVPPDFQLNFSFPINIMIVLVADGFVSDSISNLVKECKHKIKVYIPETPMVGLRSYHLMFYKICEEHFSPWIGSLICGNLNAKIVLSPNPAPYNKITDFDQVVYTLDQMIEICGFVDMQHVGSPGAVSRHLVLPYSSSMAILPPTVDEPKLEGFRNSLYMHGTSVFPFVAEPSNENDDDVSGEGHVPSFCVLLHGALKVENMAAICYVGKDWYGILYSWADSKKKSNLMLSLLEPGPEPVPWLGNLNDLVIPSPEEMTICEQFPVKPVARRVFLPNPSSWIRPPGLQADIQKVLRHARKLPDKTQQFFKELNRVRKAALSIGFVQLLEGLAAILERECTVLPGTAHPACALQLSHASHILKEPSSLDIRYNMMPLKMSFSNNM